VPSLLNVRTNTAVRAEEEDKSPDFFKGKAADPHRGSASGCAIRSRSLGRRNQETFRCVPEIPEVYFATVMIQIQRSNSRMVSSEGSAIVSPALLAG